MPGRAGAAGNLRERLTRWAAEGPLPARSVRRGAGEVTPPGLGTPLLVGVLSTVATFVFAYVGYLLFEDRFPRGFFEIWRRWDTIHYLSIAQDGYSADPARRFLIIWPPLYPVAIRLTHLLVRDYLLSGLVVAFVAFLAVVTLLYRLVALDFPEAVARRAVIYLAIFPTAYFFHAAYTESLFLALVLGSFWYARRGNWFAAGLLGGLASLTRITAFGLLPALVIEYLVAKRFRLRNVRADALFLLLIPLGFAVYLWINDAVLGHPFAFLEMARIQNVKVLSAPWVGLEQVIQVARSSGSPNRLLIVGVCEVAAGLLALVASLLAAVRLRSSYALYMILSWVNFAANSYWLSTARYLLPLFPGFILLGLWGRRRAVDWTLCTCFLMSYTMLLVLFVRGWWAF